MLTTNIWIEVGHINGAIGEITDIVYRIGTKPPDMPMYVVIHFENYNGPPWNQDEPKCVSMEAKDNYHSPCHGKIVGTHTTERNG